MENMKGTMKQLREWNGYTQEEMANKLDVSAVTYRKYEKGEAYMNIKKASKFANICHVSLDNIFFNFTLAQNARHDS